MYKFKHTIIFYLKMRFICQKSNDKDTLLLIDEIKKQKRDYIIVPIKKLARRQIKINRDDIPIGDVYFERHFNQILKKTFNVDFNEDDDYPYFCFVEKGDYSFSERIDFLKRRVFKSTLKKVIENDKQVFIKPCGKKKKFTGFVYSDHSDIYKTENASLNLEVWCSSVVKFVKEYRCFVLNRELVGCCCYSSDGIISYQVMNIEESGLDLNLIQKFINIYDKSSYIVDFGILENRETALIEVNLGMAFGMYNFDPEKCLEIIVSFYEQK